MDMPAWEALNKAEKEARELEFALNRHADTLARLALRALRSMPSHRLTDLKRELTKFDAHKQRWK